MTGIACLRVFGKTVMGGDSAAVSVDRHSICIAASPKVFRKGPCLIGYTSSFRMGQLLEHSLEIPEIPEDVNLDYWANVPFINAVRKCFSDGGYLYKCNDRESAGQFILAVKDAIFNVDDDLQATRMADNYAACGSGSESILGSLYTTHHVDMGPVERVRLALEAASKFNITVTAPYHILELSHED